MATDTGTRTLCFSFHKLILLAWGADLPGSPIVAVNDTWEHLTTFLVPVRVWSDETADH
jgi:hypothetical protein